MLELEQLDKIEQIATSMTLCSRNKLIEKLLTELHLPETLYQKGLQMLKDNWAHDKVIWEEAKAKVLDKEE